MYAVPSQIGRYQIKSRLARGGMGDLYLARDTNPLTPRLVVLKLLNASLDSAELRDRFAREARALASLSHPNIVRIFDSGELQGAPYIVMEYIRGETLGEKIKRHAPMSMGQKLKAMVEVCDGLAHAHDAGIVHRDIKPANLMVDLDGWLRILDFGIARVAETSMTRLGGQLTQMNMRIGTPGYMSPEQIEGGEIDPRTDIFAVGAVCYELLAYREAFPGATTRQIENAVLQSQPTPLASVVPGLDPALQAIVDRALEKDPAKRFQDAVSLRDAFEVQRARLRDADTPASAPTRIAHRPSGTRTRDSRANAAFTRALEVYEAKAFDASRRFAIEALAEDPNHGDARTLLSRLDPDAWDENAATLIADGEAETVLQGAPSAGHRLRAVVRRYRWVGLGAAVLLAVGAVALAIVSFWPSGHLLTITRPEHGTITGPGISCGTRGSDCSATIAGNETVELQVDADKGFLFVGFTGNCAPSGRTIMAAPRTCGATFEKIPGYGQGPEDRVEPRVLTVTPPKGGTVHGLDIKCGTQGSACSAAFPHGVPVTLHATADKGFSLERFTGDCTPEGEVQMTAARTCSASFRPAQAPTTTTIRPRTTSVHTTSVPPTTQRPEFEPSTSIAETSSVTSTIAGGSLGPPPPVKQPDQFAREGIERTLRQFCAAYEQRDVGAIRQVFPAVPRAVGDQLKQFRSVQCTLAGEPVYDELDWRRGKAVVSVGLRLVLEFTVGGERTQETLAKIRLSQSEQRAPWLIESIEHRAKR